MYTFKQTSSGTIQVFQNGNLISTTTPQQAALAYGYGAPTSTSTTIPTSAQTTSSSIGVQNTNPQAAPTPVYVPPTSNPEPGYGPAASSPTTPKLTAVTLGNGQTAYVDTQGNFYNAQGQPISDSSVASSTAGSTPTSSTSQGLAYDPSWSKYGIDQNTWNSLNSEQQGVVSAAMGAAKGLYGANASSVTVQSALQAASTDPNIVAKYADALGIDKEQFQQTIQQVQSAASVNSQTQQMQFENERKALAESYAAAGAAYSGYRNNAQQQLGETEQGVVTSSLSQLQKSLNDATSAFESKYGTSATTPASISFTNPFSSSAYSLSGQSQSASPDTSTVTGQLAGGITGSQPVQKSLDITDLASKYVNLGQIIPTTPA